MRYGLCTKFAVDKLSTNCRQIVDRLLFFWCRSIPTKPKLVQSFRVHLECVELFYSLQMEFTKCYLESEQCDWLHIASIEMEQKSKMREDQFVSLFGLSSKAIHKIHFVYLLESHLWKPKYLLWAFNFLKTYNVRRCSYTSFRNCSENIFRLKVWKMIKLLYTEMDEVLFFFSLFYFILSGLN